MAIIYYTDIFSSLKLQENADTFLTKNAYEKYNRFKKHDDKLRILSSQYLLYNIFSKDKAEKTTLGPHGKPYIENEKFFNISHSGDYVVLACDDNNIGIDIEFNKPRNFSSITNRCFNNTEIDFIYKSDEPLNAFYKLWTLKESYLKFTGSGFSLSPKNFTFEFLDDDIFLKNNCELNFYINTTLKNHTISLCTYDKNFNNEIIYIPIK